MALRPHHDLDFALYEANVQSPEADVAFLAGVFRRRAGRTALVLREDFSGTAALSAAWVRSHAARRAVAVDQDPAPLAYAARIHRPALGDQAGRLALWRGEVRRAPRRHQGEAFDVIAAFNFSTFVFHRRDTLLAYLRAARAALARDGLLFLDCFGGSTAQGVSLEVRPLSDGGSYIWEQAAYDPIGGLLEARIHFRLANGTVRRDAFRYHWRLWQPVELVEALAEAGFAQAQVYLEDHDAEGEPTGRFRPRRRAEALPAWNAYVVGAAASPRRKRQRPTER